MGVWDYWGLVLRMAWRHSLDQTQYVIFGLLLVSGLLGWLFPVPAMIVHWLGWDIDIGGWKIAALIFSTIIAVRIFLAPYWIYNEQSGALRSLRASSVPMIRVFVEGPGVHDFPCTDGSYSKYVQFTVTPATDTALIGCEVKVQDVSRVNSNGTSTPLAEEHINFGWSNRPDLSIDIAPKVEHRANLFWVNDQFEDLLHVETRPVKVRLPTEIQARGDYRIAVNVIAKNAPTLSARFLFHWGGFDEISLKQEI